MRCPCKENKCHLGIHPITPKQFEKASELLKVQKKFFMGHGIKTNDPKEAANIFMNRDHKKILELLLQYYHGKLGVYMVPPMFFGEVPEAIKLDESIFPKQKSRVRGDISEKKVFHALKNYFGKTGDDVLIIHSHKFLNKRSVNEKDFIIFNLSKGNSSSYELSNVWY